MVVRINNQPAAPGTDVAELLRGYPPGRPLLLTVMRGTESVRLTGRYAPTVLPAKRTRCFRAGASRAASICVRTGNRVEATTSGVARVHAAAVAGSVRLQSPGDGGRQRADGLRGHRRRRTSDTLLKWAARDNDRTMLFAAALLDQTVASGLQTRRHGRV